jgi:hypothetical protein
MDHQHAHHGEGPSRVDPPDSLFLLPVWLWLVAHRIPDFMKKGRPFGRPLSKQLSVRSLLDRRLGRNGRIGRHRRIGRRTAILGRWHVTSGNGQHERQSQKGKKLTHFWSPFHFQNKMASGKNGSHWVRPSAGYSESGIVLTLSTVVTNDDKNVITKNRLSIQSITFKSPWNTYARLA